MQAPEIVRPRTMEFILKCVKSGELALQIIKGGTFSDNKTKHNLNSEDSVSAVCSSQKNVRSC